MEDTRTFRGIKELNTVLGARVCNVSRQQPSVGTDQRPTSDRPSTTFHNAIDETRKGPEGEIPPLHQFVFSLSVHQRRRYHIPLDNRLPKFSSRSLSFSFVLESNSSASFSPAYSPNSHPNRFHLPSFPTTISIEPVRRNNPTAAGCRGSASPMI